VCEATAKGGTPGKPGWSYFCTRYTDTKILLAYAPGIAAEILFCGKAAKKIGAESPAPARGAGEAPKFFSSNLIPNGDFCQGKNRLLNSLNFSAIIRLINCIVWR
jgi:hypothetical protein